MRSHRRLVFGVLLLLFVLIVAFALRDRFRQEPPPASPAVLENISEKNEEAAIEAAAQQRVESKTKAEAADIAADAADLEAQATNAN